MIAPAETGTLVVARTQNIGRAEEQQLRDFGLAVIHFPGTGEEPTKEGRLVGWNPDDKRKVLFPEVKLAIEIHCDPPAVGTLSQRIVVRGDEYGDVTMAWL